MDVLSVTLKYLSVPYSTIYGETGFYEKNGNFRSSGKMYGRS